MSCEDIFFKVHNFIQWAIKEFVSVVSSLSSKLREEAQKELIL